MCATTAAWHYKTQGGSCHFLLLQKYTHSESAVIEEYKKVVANWLKHKLTRNRICGELQIHLTGSEGGKKFLFLNVTIWLSGLIVFFLFLLPLQ